MTTERLAAWRERVDGPTESAIVAVFQGSGTAQQHQVVDAYVSHCVQHATWKVLEAFMSDIMPSVFCPPPWATTGPAPMAP